MADAIAAKERGHSCPEVGRFIMKIIFMGTPAAAMPSLQRLVSDSHEIVAVYSQPDRPSGRGNKITFSPVKEFAVQHDLPVFQPIKIKTPEALEEFRSHKADVAVVVAYGRILPESFLNAFPKWGDQRAFFSFAKISRSGSCKLGDRKWRNTHRRDDDADGCRAGYG